MNDPALLEQIFVAREALAERLLSRIRDSAETGNRHYSLVVGPRGIGKTHLVSVIHYRVKNDPILSKKLCVAWLNEDPYSVSSYARLLREIIFQLDREYGLPRWAEQLASIQDMERDEDRERALESIILRHLNGRVLLIIAENLDTIFEGLGDDGQKKLRAFLQVSQPATLLATATSLTPDLEDRDRPFFGFFNQYELQPFILQECIDVLVRIALSQKDEPLAAFLRSAAARARIRAVHHLAGGNPRIYVVFFQFLTCESLDGLIEPFMKLVNELVPYYQSRMQTISPQQRMLVDIVCRNESPIAVRDIAKSAFISPQSASSDCGKLRALGYLTSTKVGRESLYELREPLMRICLAAKEQRGQNLPLFVDFLRVWFTPSELKRFSADFGNRAHDEARYRDAVRDAERRHQAQVLFCMQAVRAIESEGDDEGALGLLRNLYERWPTDDLVWIVYCQKLYQQKAVTELLEVSRERVADSDTAEAWNDLSEALTLMGDKEAALDAAVRATERSNSASTWFTRYMALASLGRYEEVRSLAQKLLQLIEVEDPKSYGSALIIARCRVDLAEYEAAASVLADAITASPSDYTYWSFLLFVLGRMDLDQSCLSLSNFATTVFPDNAQCWRDHAVSLWNTGEFPEAYGALDRAIRLAPDDPLFACQRLFHAMQLGDAAASEASARQAMKCFAENNEEVDQAVVSALTVYWVMNGEVDVARKILAAYVSSAKFRNDLDFRLPILSLLVNASPSVTAQVAALWIDVFARGGALAYLGTGLVRTIFAPWISSLFASSPEALQRVLDQWRLASEGHIELTLPVRLLDVAVRYLQTNDETVFLDLPVEQRGLLEPHIDRHRRALGNVRHEFDNRIEALITSLRSRITTQAGETFLPERSPEELMEDDLEKQPCVVLQGGASTYAGLSLRVAPASLVERFVASNVVRSIKNIEAFNISGLRVAEVPGLGGYLALLPHRKNEIEVPFFISDASVMLAARTNEWLYAAKEDSAAPQLDENLSTYVRFFFTTIVGRLGAFRLADRLDDAIWLPDATKEIKQEFEQKLAPLSLVGTHEDGRIEMRGTVIFKNALFITSVMVGANWQLELTNEDILIEDLPIKCGQAGDLLVRR
jgi:tetratricopeptide (TPR) repeat protein